MISLKRTARISGLLYLVLAITGAYGIMYVPSVIVVKNDAAQTLLNIRNHEFLFRSGILSNLVGQTVFLFLGLSLYKLFEGVNKVLSRTLLLLVTVSIPISFFIIFNQLYALQLLNEPFIMAADQAQTQITIMSFLKMYDYGISVIGIFWGLWLIPFGKLICESRFMPKILGPLLLLAGLSYIADACIFILVPAAVPVTSVLVAIFSSVAELSVVIWLLAVGVRSSAHVTDELHAEKS